MLEFIKVSNSRLAEHFYSPELGSSIMQGFKVNGLLSNLNRLFETLKYSLILIDFIPIVLNLFKSVGYYFFH